MFQLPEGFADNIRLGIQRWSETSSRLANQGWTVPDSLTPADVYDMLEGCKSAEDVDATFVALFEANDGELLETTSALLLGSQAVEMWHDLLSQALDAYRRRHHLLAVPALLLAIEGVLAEDAGCNTNVKSMAAARVADIQRRIPGSITLIEWQAASAVIDNLYEGSPFTGSAPVTLNRHWILHGRTNADWSQADCLRLISLLTTLCSLFEPLPV